jgi:hypothetical protein
VGLTLAGRKKRRRGGGYFPSGVAIIGGEEREGLGRPLRLVTDAGDMSRVPLLWVADVWARGCYLKVARAGLT